MQLGGLFPASGVVLFPVAAFDAVAVGERFPCQARFADRFVVEDVEGAVEGQGQVPPPTIDDRDVAGGVRGGGFEYVVRNQNGLRCIVVAAGLRVGKKALGGVGPEEAVERDALFLGFGDDQEAAAGLDDAFGDARQDAVEGTG